MTEERGRIALRVPIVYLVGYRGTGKTTVARLLAEALGWDCVDADAELEALRGRSIRAVFHEEGEPAFREQEAAILARLCQTRRCVVATGGGAILREDNRRQLMESGWVVWLTADADTLWRRLCNDPSTEERRPALSTAGNSGREEIEEMLRFREPLYRACADTIIDTAGRTPEEVAAAVLAQLPREFRSTARR